MAFLAFAGVDTESAPLQPEPAYRPSSPTPTSIQKIPRTLTHTQSAQHARVNAPPGSSTRPRMRRVLFHERESVTAANDISTAEKDITEWEAIARARESHAPTPRASRQSIDLKSVEEMMAQMEERFVNRLSRVVHDAQPPVHKW